MTGISQVNLGQTNAIQNSISASEAQITLERIERQHNNRPLFIETDFRDIRAAIDRINNSNLTEPEKAQARAAFIGIVENAGNAQQRLGLALNDNTRMQRELNTVDVFTRGSIQRSIDQLSEARSALMRNRDERKKQSTKPSNS